VEIMKKERKDGKRRGMGGICSNGSIDAPGT